MKKFKIKHNFKFVSIIQLYAQWIREGKLQCNSDWNKNLKIKFTVQDPCNIVRKTMRQEMADELRFVIKTIVGEENFIDMIPCGTNNYCCGGGGGALQNGLSEERRAYGKIKFNQIMESHASYVVTPCHNCHKQIDEMAEYHNGNYRAVHIWTIMCLAMGILGENERTYLGPDLANLGL